MSYPAFTNTQVQQVSAFIQEYLRQNDLQELSADECALLLAKSKILRNDIGPKPGFYFRQMLRDGRDGKINLVSGAYQETPRTKWKISLVE